VEERFETAPISTPPRTPTKPTPSSPGRRDRLPNAPSGPRRPRYRRPSRRGSSALDLGEHVKPELRALTAITRPEHEDVPLSVNGHADHHVDGLVSDLPITDLDDHRIDEDPGVHRRWRLRTICGSNVDSVSLGTSISTGPISVNTGLARVPLRLLPLLRPAESCLS
jgi:hypothetical protein